MNNILVQLDAVEQMVEQPSVEKAASELDVWKWHRVRDDEVLSVEQYTLATIKVPLPLGRPADNK